MKQPRLFIIFKTEKSKLYGEIVAIDISEDATLLSSGFLGFFCEVVSQTYIKKKIRRWMGAFLFISSPSMILCSYAFEVWKMSVWEAKNKYSWNCSTSDSQGSYFL